jgi:hypothetical protein
MFYELYAKCYEESWVYQITECKKVSAKEMNKIIETSELCLFNRFGVTPVRIRLGTTTISSKNSMNMLGLVFDCKLNWFEQVNQAAVIRSNKSLNAIRILRRYFTSAELNSLSSSNDSSILFYKSEIGNSSSLNYQCKQILSASGRALRVSLHYLDPNISFFELYRIAERAPPSIMEECKIALQLSKTFNHMQPELDWDQLNWSQTNATRQITFGVIRMNNYKNGLNCLANKFHILKEKIPLDCIQSGG